MLIPSALAWIVGLSVLILAQSKTAWIAFVLCSCCVLVLRDGPGLWRRISDPLRPEFGMVLVSGFVLALLSAAALLMFGGIDEKVSSFFASSQGAQLTSLTGRDQIWLLPMTSGSAILFLATGPESGTRAFERVKACLMPRTGTTNSWTR